MVRSKLILYIRDILNCRVYSPDVNVEMSSAYFSALEKIIQVDPGRRGLIKVFEVTKGELERGVLTLARQPKVVVVTGFNRPPQETDGPPGALAIARALRMRGTEVMLLTGAYCKEVLEAGARASDRIYGVLGLEKTIEIFPDTLTDEEARQWSKDFIHRMGITAAVSIEIVGPSQCDDRMSTGSCAE